MNSLGWCEPLPVARVPPDDGPGSYRETPAAACEQPARRSQPVEHARLTPGRPRFP